MMSHPSSLLVFTVLKSKSSRTLSVIGRMRLDLSRHAFAASFSASISASGGRPWVNEKSTQEKFEGMIEHRITKSVEESEAVLTAHL